MADPSQLEARPSTPSETKPSWSSLLALPRLLAASFCPGVRPLPDEPPGCARVPMMMMMAQEVCRESGVEHQTFDTFGACLASVHRHLGAMAAEGCKVGKSGTYIDIGCRPRRRPSSPWLPSASLLMSCHHCLPSHGCSCLPWRRSSSTALAPSSPLAVRLCHHQSRSLPPWRRGPTARRIEFQRGAEGLERGQKYVIG